MSAFTVAQCIAQAQYHLSDFPPSSDPQSLEIINDVQSDIVRVCVLYPDVPWVISLVSGQQEYALDPSIIHVLSAIWQWSANLGSQWPLQPTSVDQQDYQFQNWRAQNPQTPYRYYERGGNIGFVSAPNVTTVNGYPNVTIYTQVEQPFASTSSTLPAQTPTKDAWVWGMCARWATMQRRDDASGFADLATSARNDLIKYVNGRILRQKATIRQSYSTPRNL
jgi:hypothetical protein